MSKDTTDSRVAARRPARGRGAALITARTVVALVSATALAATGYAWITLDRVQENLNTTDVITGLADVPDSPPADDGATDILLVGSDSRTDAQGNLLPANVLRKLRTEASAGVNTDTIILIRIPHNGGRAHAISIPRDTYVPIPDYREDKINAAYGATKYRTAQRLRGEGMSDQARVEQQSDQAGRRALVQTVQDLTGLHVDHYAEINLYGFYLLTEAVGGIDVCLNHATSDPDSGANFRKGRQTVSGGDALSFVRQRKNLPGGDLGRIARQQAFLASAVNKVLSTGTLTDQGRFNALLDAVRKSVVIDQDLDLVTLLRQAQALASGDVEFVTIPVTNVNASNDRGQSIVTVDRDQVRAFVANLVAASAPPASSTVSSTESSTGSASAPATSAGEPATSAQAGTPDGAQSSPTQRLAGSAVIHLNGLAAPAGSPEPIMADGVSCVD
ncbi:LCP family protein [Goodfellowiella coeruleoviolacea]|uniref:Transcriptional attenuator, LytR family n=1 Tax=Goodfellowiella coeruleoviolacea TaxID=334858 RepID=A0AAE3GL15_9PSEU|nr:LCP family protein [Goodfellowiella coeruleoviolacea]MCP2170005.1 transcriptional attenuator, LytR family [Goodfellowiella coeruleoviolacea]